MNNRTEDIIKSLLGERKEQGPEEQVAEAARAVVEIGAIDSRMAFQRIRSRIGKRESTLLNRLTRVAAVLFVPLLVASGVLLYRQLGNRGQEQFAMQEVTSPVGIRSQITLPDGSNVWLNAESTIRFKVPFDEQSRDVELSGEAFFDVHKNPEQPFNVKSGNLQVKVLGTQFNYKSFDNEPQAEVVLEEGSVSLTTPGSRTAKEVLLKPGERAVFDKVSAKTTITTERIDKYTAWHNGKLVFDETLMPDVATQLGRWYGIEVMIEDPAISNYRITTTFENESLHQVLELLQLSSPIEIKYFPATMDKNNKTQTKSKIIITGKKS